VTLVAALVSGVDTSSKPANPHKDAAHREAGSVFFGCFISAKIFIRNPLHAKLLKCESQAEIVITP
jgi:hypothetical protein